MATFTKVVRVPVTIDESDENIRKLKCFALDKVMYEARYLGNMAIRYAIAFSFLKEKLNIFIRLKYNILYWERSHTLKFMQTSFRRSRQ